MQNIQKSNLVLLREQSDVQNSIIERSKKQGKNSQHNKEFYISNFILSPNLKFLAMFEKEKITQKSQGQSIQQLRIVDVSSNNTLILQKYIQSTKATFTFDSQYFIILNKSRNVTIIDMQKLCVCSTNFNTNFITSIDQNNNLYSIDQDKIVKIYSITQKTITIYNWVSELVFPYKILNYFNLYLGYDLIITHQSDYVLRLSNQKIVKQKKQVIQNINKDEVFIFKNFLKVRMTENTQIEILLENQFNGKTLRRIKNQQGIQGNIFENKESTFFFGFLQIYDEQLQFFMFDLIRGIQTEIIHNFNSLYKDMYQVFKMNDNLIVGVNKFEEIIRYFQLSK